ncbi:MAG: PPOX class F420-dependent oxidoreductase [Actinomycetota bacterium]
MSELRMDAEEREAFLAGVHVGVLAIERADGPPLAVPVWYAYEPGGPVQITMGGASLKTRLLRASGRASLCAQQEELPYRYASVEGPVTIEELGDRRDEIVEPLAIRYLGEQMGKAYVANGIASDEVLISITPERWFTTDYGKLGS